MKRRFKQLAYLTLFFAFWAGVVWLAYISLFAQPPSCFDNKMNQGEEGVDCGGPCKTFCINQNLTPPAPLGTPRVFQPSADLLSVLVEIKNPNPGTALRQVPYKVTVSGEYGPPLNISGVASLYESEVRRFVLVRPSGGLSGLLSAELDITTSSAQWAAAETFQRPLLNILSAITSTSTDGVRVEGTVSSDDALSVTDVTVIALFYDGYGDLVGASQTVLARLNPGESSRFTIAYPDIPGIDVEATQVTVTAYRP